MLNEFKVGAKVNILGLQSYPIVGFHCIYAYVPIHPHIDSEMVAQRIAKMLNNPKEQDVK